MGGIAIASGIGLAQGLMVGTGVMVINSGLGILSRLSDIGGRRLSANAWARIFMAGVLWGCLITLFDIRVPLFPYFEVLPLFFYGGFIGVLFMALAETLDFFPACLRGNAPAVLLKLALLALALGKLSGSLYYWTQPDLW